MLGRRAKFWDLHHGKLLISPYALLAIIFTMNAIYVKPMIWAFRVWLVDQTISSIRSNNLFFSQNMNCQFTRGLLAELLCWFGQPSPTFPSPSTSPFTTPKQIIAPPTRQLLLLSINAILNHPTDFPRHQYHLFPHIVVTCFYRQNWYIICCDWLVSSELFSPLKRQKIPWIGCPKTSIQYYTINQLIIVVIPPPHLLYVLKINKKCRLPWWRRGP